MPHSLLLKLKHFLDLSPEEQRHLEHACRIQSRHDAGTQLVRSDGPLDGAMLLLEGWAMRSRSLPDGRRQVLNFILPGDFCDPTAFVERTASYTIVSMTPVRVAHIPPAQILDLVTRSPRLGAAFWWHEAYESTMLRSHLVAVGRMTAYERIAYLLRELGSRMGMVGLGQDHKFRFPGTQTDLADALGLSNVHVSRTLRRLSSEGILHVERGGITILDTQRLEACANLRTPIEHLNGAPAGLQHMLDRPRNSA